MVFQKFHAFDTMSTYALSNITMRILGNMPANLQSELGQGTTLPRRYFYQRPEDNGTFILPLKQSFIKDARLMPGTRCMLTLLAGWAGQGGVLELTESTIGKHIGRSVRQVYRYLKDASREGYLRYGYTKNRLGMITGLRIWLTFDLIRSLKNDKKPKSKRNQGRTQRSETNKTYIYNNRKDEKLERRLDRLRSYIE